MKRMLLVFLALHGIAAINEAAGRELNREIDRAVVAAGPTASPPDAAPDRR